MSVGGWGVWGGQHAAQQGNLSTSRMPPASSTPQCNPRWLCVLAGWLAVLRGTAADVMRPPGPLPATPAAVARTYLRRWCGDIGQSECAPLAHPQRRSRQTCAAAAAAGLPPAAVPAVPCGWGLPSTVRPSAWPSSCWAHPACDLCSPAPPPSAPPPSRRPQRGARRAEHRGLELLQVRGVVFWWCSGCCRLAHIPWSWRRLAAAAAAAANTSATCLACCSHTPLPCAWGCRERLGSAIQKIITIPAAMQVGEGGGGGGSQCEATLGEGLSWGASVEVGQCWEAHRGGRAARRRSLGPSPTPPPPLCSCAARAQPGSPRSPPRLAAQESAGGSPGGRRGGAEAPPDAGQPPPPPNTNTAAAAVGAAGCTWSHGRAEFY